MVAGRTFYVKFVWRACARARGMRYVDEMFGLLMVFWKDFPFSFLDFVVLLGMVVETFGDIVFFRDFRLSFSRKKCFLFGHVRSE